MPTLTLTEAERDLLAALSGKWQRVAMGIAKVDGKKIKADTFYSLAGGKFVEV